MERLTRRADGGVVFPSELLGVSLAPDNEYMHKLLTRLAAYEDTELEPEEIVSVQEEPWCVFYFNRRCNLDGDFCPEGPGCPQEMSPEDALRLLKLAQAEKGGRLVVLPDAKYTDANGEKALQKAMWTCGNTNNPVTRYTADAIAEKLCREAKEENPALTLEQLREMDGEPVWVSWAGHSSEGWALVRVWSKANSTIYLTYHNGATDLLEYILSNGAKIYRRKPEGNV